ncbi:LysM peptidoglycan-binding domain-containing protein [Schaalia sp. 19OD2882]|uniref:LysM peptidoglycan-binding domain-containing protein n=1 Tax=Schaalia sp. 19OD2882 TaxID=2794089 RepID=UPI001C1F08A5|nr:LysM peptidoglycan-binding domain-containing protein [Schaalia sp. 19OD2882]QWW18954.1 LysM peptidoglycan-binding domain-containing protein [Schaalia sp. 19OD2882]
MTGTSAARSSALRDSSARRHLRAVPESPLATVHDISQAPTARRRRELLRSEVPADGRRPLRPRSASRAAVTIDGAMVLRAVLVVVVTMVLTALAAGVGIALQPSAYRGPTLTHSVVAGESVWSLAAAVDTDRPLEDVVTDIEALNDLDAGLRVGQLVVLPVQ